jgi:NAD+ diphosphatase
MINEIAPNVFNMSLLTMEKMKVNDNILCYRGNKILVKTSERNLIIPQKNDLVNFVGQGIFLGDLDGERWFISESGDEIPDGFSYISMSEIRSHSDKLSKWIIAVGFQLYRWMEDNKFCGRCGHKMELKNDERALKCTSCGNVIFPKLSPAIIVAITKDDKLLMAKNKMHQGSFYSLIAGYVEAGETIEETVRREVMEEVGIEVKNVRYYKSQPWPFSSSLMLGFFADYDGNREIVIDETELSHADWFEAKNLPEIPNRDSVAGEMIRLFRDRQR